VFDGQYPILIVPNVSTLSQNKICVSFLIRGWSMWKISGILVQ